MNTHVVSYWQRGKRIIVPVEAESEWQAIDRATEQAGAADPQPTYNVTDLR